jgi:NAD(P)-dependent dehydrogenase (short-subunit alcohol dehydrogenase family)/pimeloyl-ACP methyl ester carboxylesterase
MKVRGADVDLAVFERGDPGDPTVLLMHGYPDTHAVWDEVAELLADRFHVVTYDVRGAGISDHPNGRENYTYELLMADLRAVLDAVSPGEPVHLVGHDWGSIQSWEAVCTMPQRFASFTSMGGPCLDHVADWMRRNSLSPKALDQLLRSWYMLAFQMPMLPELAWTSQSSRRFGEFLERREGIEPRPGHPAHTLPEDGRDGVNLYRANVPERMARPQLRRTDVPTQVIVPTKDKFVSPHLVGGLQRWVPDLKLRPLPAGHWIPRTHPALVAKAVVEHITEATGGELTGIEERELRRARVSRDRRGFEGSLVVVTGAGSGIGRATALTFAEHGATVIAADLDTEAARHTAAQVDLMHPYAVNVADPAAMEAFAKAVLAEHGVPDIVVNNAGIGMAGPFLDHTTEDWKKILDVNLWGVIHGSKLFAEQMAARGEGGHIVNTSSAAAYTPSRSMSAYATSKAAVLMLSECMRADLADLGIKVTVICPGIVDTNITRTAHFVGRSAEEERKSQSKAAETYGRRGYGPERVAAQILAAVRRDRAVQPVTPESHVAYLASRLSPALMRRLARLDFTR